MSSDATLGSSRLSLLGMVVQYSYELRLCTDWHGSFRVLLCSPYIGGHVIAYHDGYDLRGVLSEAVATMHRMARRAWDQTAMKIEGVLTLGYYPCSSEDVERAKEILKELLAGPAGRQCQGCVSTQATGRTMRAIADHGDS